MNGRPGYLLSRVVVCSLMWLSAAIPVSAQTLSVPQLLEQQERWKQLAEAGSRVQLEGRFQSRTAESFRLEQLELIFRHPPTIRLPDRIRRGQRVEVTGGFTVDGSRLFFTVQRLQVGETDEEHLRRHRQILPLSSANGVLEMLACLFLL